MGMVEDVVSRMENEGGKPPFPPTFDSQNKKKDDVAAL